MDNKKSSYSMSDIGYDRCGIQKSKCTSLIFENLPDLIRPQKAARLLDISIKTIYDWKYRGRTRNIPNDLFIKLNRSLYINTEVLKKWIAHQN